MSNLDFPFYAAAPRANRIISLEFNELCPRLLTKWMAEGHLPNFSKLHQGSDVFVTQADVEDPGQLEPWIQWYSIHTGLSYDQHRVFRLTEGREAGHDDIYTMLAAAGRKVGSFSSINVAPFAGEGNFFVADPWSDHGDAHPPELNSYNRFVSHNVREYSNNAAGMSAQDYASFLTFMARRGFSAATVARIIHQLACEKLQDKRLAWRRVALLDMMQYDVFQNYYRRHLPDFCSFFLNSAAHLQHSYWRHMEPEAFTLRPSDDELAIYGDAILQSYQSMDRLVGKFLRLAKRTDATLMFMSALSQQPFLRHEDMGGQHFHRLHDVAALMNQLGIPALEIIPTMTNQYMMHFADAKTAHAARARLAELHLENGRSILDCPEIAADATSLYFGCDVYTKTAGDTAIIDTRSGKQMRFDGLFYQIEAIKSGRHHPEGCLWIQSDRPKLHSEKCSILDILPTQMEMLGALPPAELQNGHSLLPMMAM